MTDIAIYTDGAKEALHAAFRRAYEMAKVSVCAAGLERVDGDGEIHRRQWRIVFGEEVDDRSLRQNRFYWGVVLKQISQQAPGGWTADAWHEAWKRTVLGYEIVSVQVAGRKRRAVYRRLRSTSALTVKQMSDYLDQVIATATTDLGVVFDFDLQEREAVRYVKPKRKTAAVEREAVPA